MPSGVEIRELRVSYNGTGVLTAVDLSIPAGKVTAVMGPSGCGKTTLLRCLNRLTELTPECRVQGTICLDGEDIRQMDPMLLRRRVGMVFQKPNPFPMSVRENVLYGVKAIRHKVDHGDVVRSSLEKAALWNEVKDRLGENAYNLSLGQQQRLCVARSLAISPQVILLDEPAAALDPLSSDKLESSIVSMKGEFTVVLVTHNISQAWRISDHTAFIYEGRIIESGATSELFGNPQREETKEYIAGRFG
jgi:phosphate transport system ATP-binding protein